PALEQQAAEVRDPGDRAQGDDSARRQALDSQAVRGPEPLRRGQEPGHHPGRPLRRVRPGVPAPAVLLRRRLPQPQGPGSRSVTLSPADPFPPSPPRGEGRKKRDSPAPARHGMAYKKKPEVPAEIAL